MATPVHHAISSVKNWGGKLEDYIAIHNWFDDTKAYHPDFRHRVIRHHSLGIKECIEKFGDYIVNSDNKKVPVKLIGEQHVKEDCGYVPSLSDWLINLNAKPFMVKTVKIERSVA
jgi:predicted nucleotide-binding protein (sugar kinase/HSP70/actin superfamily)